MLILGEKTVSINPSLGQRVEQMFVLYDSHGIDEKGLYSTAVELIMKVNGCTLTDDDENTRRR
jgi:hypothetical protein